MVHEQMNEQIISVEKEQIEQTIAVESAFSEKSVPINQEIFFMPYLWRGEKAELVKVYDAESKLLSQTLYDTWTPITNATTIVNSADLATMDINTEKYEYIVDWKFVFDPVYSGATNKARTVKAVQDIYYYIVRRPSNLTNIASGTNNYNSAVNINTPGIIDYYNSSSSHTFTWSVSYGVYMVAAAPTFGSNTEHQTTMTIKKPSISARCSTTYFSVSNAGKVVKNQSKYTIKCYVYRCKVGSYPFSIYQDTVALYNNGLS